MALLAAARADEAGFRLLWWHACREPRFARYADELRRRAVAAVRVALAGRMPREHLEWAAHAVVGYLVEAVLNWLEFGDPVVTTSSWRRPTRRCGRGCAPGPGLRGKARDGGADRLPQRMSVATLRVTRIEGPSEGSG